MVPEDVGGLLGGVGDHALNVDGGPTLDVHIALPSHLHTRCCEGGGGRCVE